MPDEKRPFHEVASRSLVTAPIGITSDLASVKAAEVATWLDVLYQSKMPAKEARKIAMMHAGLPTILRNAGQESLAVAAEETLTDLRTRQDEKKEDVFQRSTPE